MLFIIFNEYVDWESVFLVVFFYFGLMLGSEIKYVVKIVVFILEVVCFLGGFCILLDYSFDIMFFDYVGLVLIGGM